jgi:hypothetical protein
MKPEGLLTSHKTETTSIFTARFSNIRFSIIFPFTPRSPSYPFSVNFPNNTLNICSLYIYHPHLSYFLFQSPTSPNYVICWFISVRSKIFPQRFCRKAFYPCSFRLQRDQVPYSQKTTFDNPTDINTSKAI